MYNIRLPKWIANISGSEYKEKGSYQYGRNAYYGITLGKKIPLKNEKFNLEISHIKGYAIMYTSKFI